MSKSFIWVLAAAVVAGLAGYSVNSAMAKKNAALELSARKAEASLKRAEAEMKKAEAEAKKAEEAAKAAADRKTAAEAEKLAKLAAQAEAEELAKVKRAEAQKAEAERAVAKDNARKAEAALKAAEAQKAQAEAMAEYASATNELKQAELQMALVAAQTVELDLKRILAASNTLALQKHDYQSKLAEIEKLQAELRRREEETRPNKTLLQLMAQNEAARQAELEELAKKDAKYAEEEAIRRRILREGVPAAPKKPLSKADARLKAAQDALDEIGAEAGEVAKKEIVLKFEEMIRLAVADGRVEDADLYLKALKSLVPDYE
jgi:hypothetical protein